MRAEVQWRDNSGSRTEQEKTRKETAVDPVTSQSRHRVPHGCDSDPVSWSSSFDLA